MVIHTVIIATKGEGGNSWGNSSYGERRMVVDGERLIVDGDVGGW